MHLYIYMLHCSLHAVCTLSQSIVFINTSSSLPSSLPIESRVGASVIVTIFLLLHNHFAKPTAHHSPCTSKQTAKLVSCYGHFIANCASVRVGGTKQMAAVRYWRQYGYIPHSLKLFRHFRKIPKQKGYALPYSSHLAILKYHDLIIL